MFEDMEKSSRPSQRRGCVWTGLAVGVGVSAWLCVGYREAKYLVPPDGVNTLSSLAATPPPTSKLSIIDDQGARYFVWIGKARKVLLASGPPVYVFDASGKLVGRSIDIGDSADRQMQRYFQMGLEGREVSFTDALKLASPR
jgi:hypothetical protein